MSIFATPTYHYLRTQMIPFFPHYTIKGSHSFKKLLYKRILKSKQSTGASFGNCSSAIIETNYQLALTHSGFKLEMPPAIMVLLAAKLLVQIYYVGFNNQ